MAFVWVCGQKKMDYTHFRIDNEYVCIQTHLDFIFCQGGWCLCGCVWLSPSVFTASFTGSLYRNLGCECIPTFHLISYAWAPIQQTNTQLLEMRLHSCFLRWSQLLFLLHNTPKWGSLSKRRKECIVVHRIVIERVYVQLFGCNAPQSCWLYSCNSKA